jgi:hypothetical protein
LQRVLSEGDGNSDESEGSQGDDEDEDGTSDEESSENGLLLFTAKLTSLYYRQLSL